MEMYNNVYHVTFWNAAVCGLVLEGGKGDEKVVASIFRSDTNRHVIIFLSIYHRQSNPS